MDKAKKQRIITVVLSVFILGGLFLFTITQIKTGKEPVTVVLSTSSPTSEYVSYTMPPGYTKPSDPGLAFSYPKESVTESKESLFTFAGTCGNEYPLLCNGIPVTLTEIGTFSAEFNLMLGDNSFVFTYGDTVREFTVRYSIDILTQIAPSGLTEIVPGTQIEILALAYKDAVVTAYVGGQAVPMSATERNAFSQSEGTKDYKTFSGVFTAPFVAAGTSLGQISVTGSYGGQSVTLSGGEILLHADMSSIASKAALIEQEALLSSYYDSGDRGLLTPYYDHGLGLAQFCEILKDKAETTNAGDITDNSDIFCSPFSRGTFDYVTGAVTYEDELMYILSSGRKVYAKEARFIPAGYVLPENSVSASDVMVNDNTTDIYLNTDWAVPTGISLSPQGYYIGYQNRPFNVSSFTAEYLDVVFYHTSQCSGTFDLPEKDQISSAELINNGNGSVTLRCQLARKGKFCGCSVDIAEDGRLRVCLKNVKKSSRTVVIDAGHGGADPGAAGIFPGVQEQIINFELSTRIAAFLESSGVHVIMTRTGNQTRSRNDRITVARQYKPDAFVAVHSDYASNASISGTHAFYYYPWSMELAKCVHEQMVAAYRSSIYPPGTVEYEQADRGVKFYPFQVTRLEECPAILIECGFVSNASDCSVLLTPSCQDIIAAAVANGIVSYLNSLD